MNERLDQNGLTNLLLEQAKSYADVARAAHSSRDREVELLREQIRLKESEIVILENKLDRARKEIASLNRPIKPIEGFDDRT